MSNIFDLIWKDDPLKTASDTIQHSNFGPRRHDKETPINLALLLVASLFVAVTKSLYGQAGFTLVQHLIASIVIVVVSYIGVGIALIAVGRLWTSDPYVWVNNRLRCFLTCLVATLMASVLLFFLEGVLIDWGIAVINRLPISEWWKNRLPNLAPALFYSTIGCVVIYLSKRKTDQVFWYDFLVYGFFTWFFLYFTAFDRKSFFETVMKPLSKKCGVLIVQSALFGNTPDI